MRELFPSYRDNDNINASYRTIEHRGYTIAIQTKEHDSSGRAYITLKAVTDNNTVIEKRGQWIGSVEELPELLGEWLPEVKESVDERADRDGEVAERTEEVITGVFDN